MIEVEHKGERKFIVNFIARKGLVIKVESLKHYVKKFGEPYELDSSLCAYFLIAVAAIIEVVLVEKFGLDVPLQAELKGGVIYLFVDVLDDEDNVLEVLFAD